MKRSKRLLILTGVLTALCIATLALSRFEEQQEQIKASGDVVLEIPTDSVTALGWEYADGDGLAFAKGDTGWLYEEDEAFPVSEEKVQNILDRYASFAATFIIENVEDYAQYGLDDPECTITITAEETHTIRLGDFSVLDAQRYVDIGDGNVYLVSEDPMEDIDASLSSMILHNDIPDFGTVNDITFTGTANYAITRRDESSSYSPDDIYFTAQDEPLDTTSVKKYLNTVAGLGLMSYVTYNASGDELAAYGLVEPELSVTIGYTNDEGDGSVTLHLSRITGEDESDTACYVRVGDSPIVYTLDDTDYAILAAADYDDLRHKEVFWADLDTVTAIDATLEDETHSLTSTDGESWSYGETEVDVTDILGALQALTADSFTAEAAAGELEIALTLHLNSETFPTVQIELYRYDGSSCLAVVDGEPTSLIARSDAMDLVEAVQAIVLN